jgi:hypothetical protein
MDRERKEFEKNPAFIYRPDVLAEMFPKADGQPRVGKRQTQVLLAASLAGGIWVPNTDLKLWRGKQAPELPYDIQSADRQVWGDFYTVGALVRRGLLRFVINDPIEMFSIDDRMEQAAVAEVGKRVSSGAIANGWLVITREGWIALFKKVIRNHCITFDRNGQSASIYYGDLRDRAEAMGIDSSDIVNAAYEARRRVSG